MTHFGEKGPQPQTPEDFEGRREVNFRELGMARLGRQNEMIRPIADLLAGLVEAGKITEQELQETLRDAYRPVGSYAKVAGRMPTAAETASDITSARFLAVLALRLSKGDAQKMAEMLGSDWISGSEPISPFVEEIAKELKDPSKTRWQIGK